MDDGVGRLAHLLPECHLCLIQSGGRRFVVALLRLILPLYGDRGADRRKFASIFQPVYTPSSPLPTELFLGSTKE